MSVLAWIIVSVISITIGVIIGIFIGKAKSRAAAMGWLRIDHSEPDEPARMFVELKGITPDMIAQHKFVLFEVINQSYISRD